MLCYICENSIFSVSIYTSWSCLLQGNASDKGEKPCRTPTLSIDSSPYQSTIFYNNLQYLPCISQFESWSSETKHKNYFTLFETTCICTKIDEQAIPANFNMQVKLHLFQAIQIILVFLYNVTSRYLPSQQNTMSIICKDLKADSFHNCYHTETSNTKAQDRKYTSLGKSEKKKGI